jgi:hypothetical protein
MSLAKRRYRRQGMEDISHGTEANDQHPDVGKFCISGQSSIFSRPAIRSHARQAAADRTEKMQV